jgi:tRNA(adenine34) deaminase
VTLGTARWEPAMRLALLEARLCLDTGDVPVGAVVLSASVSWSGPGATYASATVTRPVMRRCWRCAVQPRPVGQWRLDGCTLVVTLEPCTMCAGAAVLARVGRVVFGAYDDKAGAVGSLWDVVRDRRLNHRPEVVAEVLAPESGSLLQDFFAGHRG